MISATTTTIMKAEQTINTMSGHMGDLSVLTGSTSGGVVDGGAVTGRTDVGGTVTGGPVVGGIVVGGTVTDGVVGRTEVGGTVTGGVVTGGTDTGGVSVLPQSGGGGGVNSVVAKQMADRVPLLARDAARPLPSRRPVTRAAGLAVETPVYHTITSVPLRMTAGARTPFLSQAGPVLFVKAVPEGVQEVPLPETA